MKNYKKISIFAMRKLSKVIVFYIQSLFLYYHKGVVPDSYLSNDLGGFRKLKGLHPHFINLTILLMRKPVNKVNGYILLATSQNYISQFIVLLQFVNSKKLAI